VGGEAVSVIPTAPSSGVSRHLLPQGEKEETTNSPSPLEGEGGALAPDEGAVRSKVQFARQLRRNLTPEEVKVWVALRGRRFEGFKFRRQVPIGKYIVDFVCQEFKLIVELDGGQHSESKYDEQRDAWLKAVGYNVLRFWNVDVNQELDGVLLTILDSLNQPLIRPSGTFSLKGRRGEPT
jgi:very-short-patch-repair endonuclease